MQEALRARRRELRCLWIREDRTRAEVGRLKEMATALGVPVRHLPPASFPARLGDGLRTQGVCLDAGPLPLVSLEDLMGSDSPRCIVAVDQVQDPQNLGSIVRVAEAVGGRGLLLQERRTAPLSPSVSRASAGALEHCAVARVANLPRSLKLLKKKGFWVMGADSEHGSDPFEAPSRLLEGDVVLVFGAEGKGLRPGIRAVVDAFLRIPMQGRVRSLNVGSAAAVLLFEWRRRQRPASPTQDSGAPPLPNPAGGGAPA